MIETIDTIIQWHRETFPDATLKDQICKYEEERKEWLDSDCNDLSELADMFIVACGLSRFDMYTGLCALENVIYWLDYKSKFGMSELVEEVERKMEKNRKRTWKKQDNDSYHHINKGD